jgi:hypothetical protein
MSEATSAASDARTDDWADVELSDPTAGEWDLDTIVAGGDVEYVALRIRRDLVASFVDCLVEDLPASQAQSVVDSLAATYGSTDSSAPEE